jgi:hypothetical protein
MNTYFIAVGQLLCGGSNLLYQYCLKVLVAVQKYVSCSNLLHLVNLLIVGQCECTCSNVLQFFNDAAVVQIHCTAFKLLQLFNLLVVGQYLLHLFG